MRSLLLSLSLPLCELVLQLIVRIPSHDNQRSAEAIIRAAFSNPVRRVESFIPFRFAKGQWYNASSCCTLLHTAACHAEARLLIFRYAATQGFPRLSVQEDTFPTLRFFTSNLEIFQPIYRLNIFPDSPI